MNKIYIRTISVETIKNNLNLVGKSENYQMPFRESDTYRVFAYLTDTYGMYTCTVLHINLSSSFFG